MDYLIFVLHQVRIKHTDHTLFYWIVLLIDFMKYLLNSFCFCAAAIMNFLCQDLEGTRLLEKLAITSCKSLMISLKYNTFLKSGWFCFVLFNISLHCVADRSEVSPSSLAMLALADTNGPTGKVRR